MSNYENQIVELRADVHTMWKLQCKNLYNSQNLGALAIRECLQNSIDSIISALNNNEISKGRIDIDIDWEQGTLSISDNGIGMDIETIHTKFLTLGGTTKDNDSNVGGFGLAKSVILGCGNGFKVETQDNVFSSDDLGNSPIQKCQYRQGTKITVYQVQVSSTNILSPRFEDNFTLAIKDYIETSIIPDNIEIYINNILTQPRFKYTAKNTKVPAQFNIASSMIPRDTILKLNVFKTKSPTHYLYVQLRGLTQFKKYLGWNATSDIVLNFDTLINPRSIEYPFSTNRESLKGNYLGIIEAITDKVSKAPLSVSDDSNYHETIYGEVESSESDEHNVALVAISADVATTAQNITQILGGMEAQGGYIQPSLADYIQQYNSTIERTAEQYNMSKQEVIQSANQSTLIEMNNPLKFSWIVCKSKNYKPISRISQSRIIAHVLKWEAILKIMFSTAECVYNKPFYPGIVLEKGTLGLCMEKYLNIGNKSLNRDYIMFNPTEMLTGSNLEQTIWIMSVAAHELAHLVCGQLESHGETWAYERERIMNRNLKNIDIIMNILTKKTKNKSEYSNKSIGEIEDIAYNKGINVSNIQHKYTNPAIYRMRLIMAIKSCS